MQLLTHYYTYLILTLPCNSLGKDTSLSGIDPSLGEKIITSGGLVAFSDSTWRCPDHNGFNMFGFVVYFMGAPISFVPKQLKVVALSSAEAEYAAAACTCREMIFIRNVLVDLGFLLIHAMC